MAMDNNNNRETSGTVLAVSKAAMWMDPFFKITATGTALMVTCLARMAKERKIRKGDFKSVTEFLRASDGKYSITNIPVIPAGENAVMDVGGKRGTVADLDIRKELDEMGIKYVILPDLDKSDGFLQVAIHEGDKEVFGAWMERYLAGRMGGGEKTFQDLQNLTGGKTSIVSIPVEGREEMVAADFKALGINFSFLPDLNVGDGEIQLVVADADIQKVEHWYKLYRDDRLKRDGETPETQMPETQMPETQTSEMRTSEARTPEAQTPETQTPETRTPGTQTSETQTSEIQTSETRTTGTGRRTPEMRVMDMGQYMKTGEMTEEQYVDTMDEELSRANGKYEGKAAGEIENRVAKSEKRIRTSDDAAYDRLHGHPEYVEISINKEMLVDRSSYGDVARAREAGLFTSRVPSTWGAGELTLVIPQEQVFVADGGRTFVAFLKKDEAPLVMEKGGKPVPVAERMTGQELQDNYYNPVERDYGQAEKRQYARNVNLAVQNQENVNKERVDTEGLDPKRANPGKTNPENGASLGGTQNPGGTGAGARTRDVAGKVAARPIKPPVLVK